MSLITVTVMDAYQGVLTIAASVVTEDSSGWRVFIWNPSKHDTAALRGSRANGRPNGGSGKVPEDVTNALCKAIPLTIRALKTEDMVKMHQYIGVSYQTTVEDLPLTQEEQTQDIPF